MLLTTSCTLAPSSALIQKISSLAYSANNRRKRKETDRFRKFAYADLIKRDKTNLDIFWLRDD